MIRSIPLDTLLAEAARIGHPLTEAQGRRLLRYVELLLDANRRLNLTAIVDPEGILRRHLLDSLRCLEGLPADARALADVGSGGGLPGIVLKVARPDLEVRLIESVRKKARFLAATVEALGLEGIQVDPRRAEEAGRDPALRESFDAVTARAVAPLPVLAEYAFPLLRIGGVGVFPKKGEIDAELEALKRALPLLGGGRVEVRPAPIPGLPEEGRVLVLAVKAGPTPDRYPRRPGIPAKRPLGGRAL